MTRITGRQINVGLGIESVRGTGVAAGYFYPKLDFDFDDKNEKVLNTSGFGVIEKNNAAHVVKKWAEGSLNGKVWRNGIGYLLVALFGASPTTTTVETSAKQHAFALAQNNQHKTLSVSLKDPNQDLRFAMAMIDSFTLDIVLNDYIKMTAGLVAKHSASNSSSPAYVADTEFIPKHVVLKNANNTGGLGAAAALTDIVSISLQFKKNVSQTQGLGSIDLENIVNTDFEVSGKIEKYYNGTVFKDFDHNNVHQALRIDMIDTDTTVGAVTNPSLRFDFAEVAFKNWTRGMGNSDVTIETIEFDALWNLAAAAMVTGQLVNDVASY